MNEHREHCQALVHDTVYAYKRQGCRCPQARERNRAMVKKYRDLAKARGVKKLSGGHKRVPPDGFVFAAAPMWRLRALVAAGYWYKDLAELLGVDVGWVSDLCGGHIKLVDIDMADVIKGLFLRLEFTTGPSESAREWAQSQQWPPPLAWDEKDFYVNNVRAKTVHYGRMLST